MIYRFPLVGILGLLIVPMSIGCSSGKLAMYPVTGQVLVDKKAAPGVMVIFCPVEGSEAAKKQRPVGNTDADGKFHLTTLRPNDGAPLGQYKVLVQWADGASGGGADRLGGRYMNLEKTPLTATVSKDSLELPPFELSSK